jgi:hypothetical protein
VEVLFSDRRPQVSDQYEVVAVNGFRTVIIAEQGGNLRRLDALDDLKLRTGVAGDAAGEFLTVQEA